MIKRIVVSIGTTALAFLTATSVEGQNYSNAVQALNPVAYWPLQETTAPSGGLYIATNSGTAGAAGNGYYETWWQTNGNPGQLTNASSIVHIAGAIAGDSDTAMAQGVVGQYVVIPRTTNGVANPTATITAPFSIEAWIYPTNGTLGQLKPILAEGFNSVIVTNLNSGTPTLLSNGSKQGNGVALGLYSTNLYFDTWNATGTAHEIDANNIALNKWHHIVATFDGTTKRLWVDEVQIASASPGVDQFGQRYAPDMVSPLIVGGGNELGISSGANVPFGGGIDEVAIYNSALTQTQITNHFQTGTNASAPTPYVQVVKGDSPSIYLRLDEPSFTPASLASSPVANNYGSLGAAANGSYLPGATPGSAGPAYSGFGSSSYGVALNGFNGGVDVGNGALPSQLNPTNGQPMTVTAWFKGNPSDCVARFQEIVGHSDSGWRLSLDTIAGNHFNPGNGPELQFASIDDEILNGMLLNDGNWHFVAGVSDGTNDSLYLDGVLVKSGTNEGVVTNGSQQDVILGGDPQYLAPQPLPIGGGGRWFDGSIAQVAFFTNALNGTQVASIYSAAAVPPSIRIQPASQAVFQGLNVSIPAFAVGSGPLSDQWYKGSSPVSGQTSSALTFSPATSANAGSYYLVVANSAGSVTSSVIQVTVSASTATPYNAAVEQLKPVAYWPLNETAQPPQGQYIATNLGTLGTAANGYYQSYYQPITIGITNTFYATNTIIHVPGATGDGDTALSCGEAGGGQYVVLPRTTNGLANPAATITGPFTIETWVYPTNSAGTLRPIVNQGRVSSQNLALGAYTNEYYGFSLGQYSTYFYFQCYNGTANANGTAPEIDCTNALNHWYHLVVTFDGSTISLYTNGVLVNSKATTYVPDPNAPLMIGSGTEPSSASGAVEWAGNIDDVAIYPTSLTQTQITNHYAAVGANYSSTILADHPSIYYRLDEPAFNSYPSQSTYPVANNYGTLGAAANGAYMPGTTPGVAGPSYPGLDSSTGVAINGFYGGVDIGGGLTPVALNPIGNQPQTVVAWFQTDPVDARFQEIVSRGDSSWRLTFNGNNGNPSTAPFDPHFNPGNNPELQFANINDVLTNNFFINDGNWHMLAGVSDGNNVSMYIDGALAKTGTGAGALAGSALDTMIGGSPAHTTPIWNSANIRYFDGQIAQVAYFTNALTALQVQGLYSVAGVPLTLVGQPQSATFNSGTSASLSVTVRGSSPIYQWYSTNVNNGNVAPVTGQTNASLVFNPANLTENGFYFVIATNSFNAVTSSVAQLTIVGPPQFISQSANDLRVFVGTTPTIHLQVIGPSLVFQWFSNKVAIANATNTAFTFTTNDTSEPITNTYSCVITNSFGPITDSVPVMVLADPTAPYPARVLADKPSYYFRLDEPDQGYPNDGVTGYDYTGGQNGYYTNANLSQSGYSSATDPAETSAQFGQSAGEDSFMGQGSPYVDFATPSGSNAEFSVEAWINSPGGQSLDAGIVCIGYGFGGEEFDIDCPNDTLRCYINTASGATVHADSTFQLGFISGWHHVAAVCDEAGGQLSFYIDGELAGSGVLTPGSGIRTETLPLSIGSRVSSNNVPHYDNQFFGYIDDVAIYNYALTPAQIQSHYFSSGIAPLITEITPAFSTNNPGTTASFTVTATGTQPLSYEWFDNNSNPIPGQTNATLVLTNVQQSQGGQYEVAVANIYGNATTNATLVVNQGAPVITADLTPTNLVLFAGELVTYNVQAGGDVPLFYQWYKDGTAVPNATNSSFSFTALLGTNTYVCGVTNDANAGSPVFSSTGTVVGMPSTTLNPANYTDKMKITFSGYSLGQTLQDFPALVQLSTNIPGFNYAHFASASGGDLRFTDAGGTVVIPSEIDEWHADGTSIIWVQVPQLSSSNTFVWAYWGNPTNTTPPPGTNVWVPPSWQNLPAYDIVYHLKESGFPYIDSTGVNPALTGTAPIQTNGLIGLGQLFGPASLLDAGSNNLGGSFTLSAWVNLNQGDTSIQTVWANKVGGIDNNGFGLYVNSFNSNPGDGLVELETGNGVNGAQVQSPTGALPAGAWHLLTCTIDVSNGVAQIYVDTNNVTKGTGAIRTDMGTTNDLNLGSFVDGALQFNGLIDEARVQFGTNTPAWITASYLTVARNASLQTYSAVSSTVLSPVTILFQSSGGNLILDGSGGPAAAGKSYTLLSTTNLTVPVSQWTPVTTSSFDSSGNFSNAVPLSPTNKALFFKIAVP